MAPEDEFLTAPAVCRRYSISRPTLRAWLNRPGLAFPRPRYANGRLYFRKSELQAWEAASQPRAKSPPVKLPTPVSPPLQSYEALVAALRARRIDLGLSCLTVDEISGLQIGYTNKLENAAKPYGRSFGPVSLELWLAGLGVGLQIVDLPDGRRRERSPRKSDGGQR